MKRITVYRWRPDGSEPQTVWSEQLVNVSDSMSCIYDEEGYRLGCPSGGLTGRGDGTLQNFYSEAEEVASFLVRGKDTVRPAPASGPATQIREPVGRPFIIALDEQLGHNWRVSLPEGLDLLSDGPAQPGPYREWTLRASKPGTWTLVFELMQELNFEPVDVAGFRVTAY